MSKKNFISNELVSRNPSDAIKNMLKLELFYSMNLIQQGVKFV